MVPFVSASLRALTNTPLKDKEESEKAGRSFRRQCKSVPAKEKGKGGLGWKEEGFRLQCCSQFPG